MSPIVLLKEVDNLIKNLGEKYFFISEWYKHKDHKQIFWNIVYYFNVLGLPTHVLTFISDELLIREVISELQKQKESVKKEFNLRPVNLCSLGSNHLVGIDKNKSSYFNLLGVFDSCWNVTNFSKLTMLNGWEIINFKMYLLINIELIV